MSNVFFLHYLGKGKPWSVENFIFSTSIDYLKGVGPARADLLNKELRIFTYGDLLCHYPFRYIDKSKIHQIKDSKE